MSNEAKEMLNCSLNGQTLSNASNYTTGTTTLQASNTTGSINAIYTPTLTVWDYWSGYYYPQVIRESYPVYIQERAKDKGKQAFEIIKVLMDKKLIKLDKVSDFVEAMDSLIKIL